MASFTEIIQGDSYGEDFINKSILPTDVGYTDWTGQWAIIPKLKGNLPSVAAGVITKVTDANLKLVLRITPDDTKDIPAGKYFLVVQVSNATLGFNKEIVQRPFVVKEQGIV